MSQANQAHTISRKTALDRAHAELIARIAKARPPHIRGAADAADAAVCADHIVDVYQAVISYVEAVVADTVNRLPVGRGCRWNVEVDLWDELNGRTDDLAGKLQRAGCRFASQRKAA